MTPVQPFAVQVVAAALHSCHWYVKVIGLTPLQVPFCTVRVWAWMREPLSDGATRFEGAGACCTVPDCADVAVVAPPLFVAVTSTCTFEPRSPTLLRV